MKIEEICNEVRSFLNDPDKKIETNALMPFVRLSYCKINPKVEVKTLQDEVVGNDSISAADVIMKTSILAASCFAASKGSSQLAMDLLKIFKEL